MDTAEKLAKELRELARGHRMEGYPVDLKARVVAYCHRERDERGRSWRWLSDSLGGPETSTLRRWCLEASAAPGGFLAVDVVGASSSAACAPAPNSSVVAVSPNGWRVEGLSVEEAAWLIGAVA